MKHVIFLFIIVPMLAGCGPIATEKGFRAMADSYQGRHIDQLVADWGPPQASYTYEDGRREYAFIRSRLVARMTPNFVFGGYYGYHGRWGGYTRFPMYREQVRQYRCEVRVSTDRKGRITGIAYRGNDCRAVETPRMMPPS